MKKTKQMSIGQDKKIESSTSYLLIFKNFISKNKKTLFLILILLFIYSGNNYFNNSSNISAAEMTNKEFYYPILVRERIHLDLVNEVESYIQRAAPGSTVNAETLVNLCQKYNIDISFVLAQGILESHLGTKGKALTTKSIFGVGAYDNGVIHPKHIYNDVNESIEPYLRLLREKYLGDKKQISDLIKDNGYTNLTGYRYASLNAYESLLRSYIISVDMNSSIRMYQDVMKLSDEKILIYFGPIEDNIIAVNGSIPPIKLAYNDTTTRKFR